MRRARHPSIFQVGKVHDEGHTLTVSGWGLGLCATACPCHRQPHTGRLIIDERQTDGHLGLISFTPGGCTCCEPWSPYELLDVLRDLADIAALQGA